MAEGADVVVDCCVERVAVLLSADWKVSKPLHFAAHPAEHFNSEVLDWILEVVPTTVAVL